VRIRRLALVVLLALAGAAGWCRCAAAVSLPRAPSSPPLTSAGASGSAGGDESNDPAAPAEADPLVSNGLGSPSCKGALAGELSATGRRNCETSGFAAAPAPTGNYGIDVHINTSVLSATTWGSTIAQDLFVAPLWMALVWAVHGLVVMLEWAFTVDLLDSAAAAGLGGGLRRMLATLTEPWLPIVLAVASVLALYHGLIRRRVADTLGEVLVMGAMMVAGIWVAIDPTGTVGSIGQWANQASLGTLAVAAQGAPSAPGRALEASLDSVFVTAIEVPWCFLEFGDVAWCREPSRLEPRLRAAGLKIATQELADRCQPSWDSALPCSPVTGAQARALERSAELLRGAQTNGALFLALPANGAARNSINEEGSLLRTLCQSSEATSCRGPAAAQAEFRTAGPTLWRIGGVVLIAAGLLGMLLLLGFVALRLLTAAVFSLLFLLLAPAMVLAPACGDGGRALFRRWVAHLLGAIASKLVFSFLLGIVLAIISILAGLVALGWWTQWLLMSAFWWGAYAHRSQLFGGVDAATVARQREGGGHERQASLVRRVREVAASNEILTAARWVKDRRGKPGLAVQPPTREKLGQLAQAGHALARTAKDEQVRRTLDRQRHEAPAGTGDAAAISGRVSAKRAQLERLGRERSIALARGNTRRAAQLEHRAKRVGTEITSEQGALNRARRTADGGTSTRRRDGGERYSDEQLQRQARFLDDQAALPSAARARGSGERRDYAALAGLVGYRREQYERLDPGGQRMARLEIDRELALRRGLTDTANSFTGGVEAPELSRRERHMVEGSFDGALQKRMRDSGHTMPASSHKRPPLDIWRQEGRELRQAGSDVSAERSSVMRDAREVAARRKRQLGKDRP
jgi:hypothetical protein